MFVKHVRDGKRGSYGNVSSTARIVRQYLHVGKAKVPGIPFYAAKYFGCVFRTQINRLEGEKFLCGIAVKLYFAAVRFEIVMIETENPDL